MTKLGLVIFSITAFLIGDTYHEGKYSKLVKSWKKYYQMAFVGFLGLSAYLFIRKHPTQSKSLMLHANELIKYMPIDKEAGDLFTPLFDFTKKTSFSNELYDQTSQYPQQMSLQEKRLISSGKTASKRSVSETKKKYVASQQGWKCGNCHKQLPAWFEVDHTIRLEHGGTNEVSNLVALCRDCHGEKTAMENL